MDDFKVVLEELEKSLTSSPSQNQETPQPEQASTQQPINPEALAEEQIRAYKGIGTSIFLSKNASLPNLQKLYPFIENRANMLLIQDIQKGSVRESYDLYLEEAKDFVLKEVLSTAKNLASYTSSLNQQQESRQPSQPTITYTMKDFYNDYKKGLENITLKYNTLTFEDGVDTGKGLKTIGEGKAELHKKVEILD